MLIKSDKSCKYGDQALIDVWQQNPTDKLWIDFNCHDRDEEARYLTKLGCHPLAISDVHRDRHPPKIEEFDNFIFMLYRGIYETGTDLVFDHLQIGLFVGENILITTHDRESISINKLFSEEGQKYLFKSSLTLGLRIFHYSCGIYLQQLFDFEEKLEALEDKFQEGGDDKMMQEIILYQSRLTKLKRTFNYHRNIGNELKILVFDEESSIVHISDQHTVTDVHERIERLLSLSQMHYDICSDLINGYLSVASHQLNATMRVLTVITAIFIPLGFLAGLYGMNFDYIPELKVAHGYFYLLGFMALIVVTLIVFFKKKRWL